MALEWPLVGRREELALIEEALTRSGNRGVVLAGEAGVGKTRLAREVLAVAESRGRTVAWAVGTHSYASIPFGALAHLLPEEVAPEQPGVPLGRTNLLRLAVSGLVGRSEGTGMVLGVDDAHLLDDLSAALVHHAASAGQLFLVASVRSGEPTPDAVTTLWKEGVTERIEVRSLSEREMDHLVEGALGSQVEGGALRRLWEATRGNPLLLRELVVAALEAETLVEDEGVWRWIGPFPAAPRLDDVMEARLGDLERQDRSAMEVVAVAGSLGEATFESLTSSDSAEALQRRGLIALRELGGRREISVSHPLYGEVLLGQLPWSRVKAVKRMLAEAVESDGARRREDLLRVATWLLDSGGSVRPDLLLAAWRRSIALYDFSLAERFARAAARAGGGFDATLALAESLTLNGRFEEAQSLLDRAQQTASNDAERTRVAIARASNLFWHMGRATEAEEILADAGRAITDPDLQDELAATRGGLLVFGDKTRQGIDLLSVIARKEQVAPPIRFQAAQTLIWGLSCAGRPEDARSLAKEMLEATDHLADELWLARLWIMNTQPSVDLFSGHLDVAEATLEPLYQEALNVEADWVRGSLAFAVGNVARARGRAATAARRLREGAALIREVDFINSLPACLGELAHALALLGDVGGAEAALAEAEERALPSVGMTKGHIGSARAWTAAAKGEISSAIDLSLQTAEATGEMGQHGFEAFSLHDVARLGAPERVGGRLAELSGDLQGELAPAFADHATALAERDPKALEEVSRRFEKMGCLLYSAEAAAEAADVYRDAGLTGSAFAATARAAELSRDCEGARTPPLLNIDVPLPLTAREREVATLAASGLANRDIAERLVVSVRTVENHLHSAYAKLGVTGREELGPILAPGGPRP